MKTCNVIAIALLAMIPIVVAQNPIDAVTGTAQEQIDSVGQRLQKDVAQHIVEGNLSQEHISQELNETRRNLMEKAKIKINQKLNENLNLTPNQLQQKAAEELKRQVNQKAQQQPGFEASMTIFGVLAIICLIRRRN